MGFCKLARVDLVRFVAHTWSRFDTFHGDPMPDEIPLEKRLRVVRLLVPVMGLSGQTYPVGTEVSVSGRGADVDGFVSGDWLPLRWWEFAESRRDAA